ncbi:serine/threonine-protein kinase VRK3 isoform X2 [Ranitomeya variabilis]|uniref:serine/threonine-protein kinase VRK3 isoform X2 n=1 Tax=Ranitomeya variabilis TaxID=490064 RepID=UPI0040572713
MTNVPRRGCHRNESADTPSRGRCHRGGRHGHEPVCFRQITSRGCYYTQLLPSFAFTGVWSRVSDNILKCIVSAQSAAVAGVTRMIINFCPQCGKKAEDEFIYCPFCGIKFQREDTAESERVSEDDHIPPPEGTSFQKKSSCDRSDNVAQDREWPSTSPKSVGSQKCNKRNPTSSPRTALKRKVSFTPEKEQAEKNEASPAKTKIISPSSKKAKNVPVQPLPENDVVTDNKNTKWVLAKLLSQEKTGLYYEVHRSSKKDDKERYVLKLDAKDGKIFNEQNFLQRAAKKVTVDKWKKSHNCPVLGIPTCIGFGTHSLDQACYRFLVFYELGDNLQTILSEHNDRLPEIAVYQIMYRMIDVLEFVHENEYVHGDITAENIYVSSDYEEVCLAGYYNAFRYCPGGNHVAQKDGSRTLHDGAAEFISLDVHNGTGPTRRSDLESLGYCMLKWLQGSLPWSDKTNPASIMEQKQRFRTDVPGLLKQCYNRSKTPDVVKSFLEKVMNMNYIEEPNYNQIRDIFSSALQKVRVDPYDPVRF